MRKFAAELAMLSACCNRCFALCSVSVEEAAMRILPLLFAALAAIALAACAVVSAGVGVAGSVVSTTVELTGDVVGAAVNSVGGDDDED
jgi:hypothetical protein